jgi:ubiquinone/menaquinone biosynthesis C-methylase UbiE
MPTHVEFWNKAAEKYARRPIKDMPSYERTMESTRAWLSPTDRVLEIGSGSGSTALLLAPDVAHIVAADISSEMVRIGTEKAQAEGVKNVTFREAAVPMDAFDGNPVDAVLAFNLLHLVPDPDATTRAVFKTLKPGGVFISKTPCLAGKSMIRLAVRAMQIVGFAPDVGFFDVATLEGYMTRSGFEIVETGGYPDTSDQRRFIVARKPG